MGLRPGIRERRRPDFARSLRNIPRRGSFRALFRDQGFCHLRCQHWTWHARRSGGCVLRMSCASCATRKSSYAASPFVAAAFASVILRPMPALTGSRRALLRAAPVAVAAMALCSACGSQEPTPLGSPSYLPPDPGGAAGTVAVAGSGGAGVAGANGGFGGLR